MMKSNQKEPASIYVPLAVAGCGVLLLLWFMGRGEYGANNTFAEIAETTAAASVPANGRRVDAMQFEEGDWKLSATWELTTDLEWAAYSDWLSQQFSPRFQRSSPIGSAELHLKQVEKNEVLTLTAKPTSSAGGASRIRLQLRISAW